MNDTATLLRGGRVLDAHRGLDVVADVIVRRDGCTVAPDRVPRSARVVDVDGCWVMPGLVDLQVHFREPGFTHKEDLLSGSRAALAGGVTTCIVMPNTQPTLDDPALVREQSAKPLRHGGVRILVAAAATKGLGGTLVTDAAALKAAGAVALTDDGLPVLDDAVMAATFAACRAHDLVFLQHAEDLRQTQVDGHHAPMSESSAQRAAGVRGQPRRAESDVVARDIALAEAAGARYHVLHCSTAASLALVKAAKARGARVTCEASPHHLLLTDADVVKHGVTHPTSADDLDPNKKMNPPLRDVADRAALVQGLVDGTVDSVATDHAPHAAHEKARGFVDGPFGVIGLETAFAALLTFVHDGTITPLRAVELMTSGPARVLGMAGQIGTFAGDSGDVAVVDPRRPWAVTPSKLLSRSKNSAFLGRTFTGRVVQTYRRGLCVWQVV
ncbi:MAG: dihydroorotase [Deltaproteobacteria bacterium]|nr:dihydroorotase [Deltaproteobacteria bacterium]